MMPRQPLCCRACLIYRMSLSQEQYKFRFSFWQFHFLFHFMFTDLFFFVFCFLVFQKVARLRASLHGLEARAAEAEDRRKRRRRRKAPKHIVFVEKEKDVVKFNAEGMLLCCVLHCVLHYVICFV